MTYMTKSRPGLRALLSPALLGLALSVAAARPASAQAQLDAHQRLAREIFRELIEINTTDATGNTTRAAEAMAARLRAAGFPETDVQVLGPHPRKGNLVARLRGTGARKPLLLLAHLDVVEAKREDWSPELDPFKFTEKDGFYYGRGTMDDKAMAAIWIANLIRFKREGFRPDRDLVVALTADEEGGEHNGVDWLLRNHRALVDAEYGLNEGGGGQSRDGKPLVHRVGASEKVYQDFRLEVTDPGGHSSQPRRDNPIYHLSEALARIGKHDFPVQLNEVTRAYFERMSRVESGQVAADMRAVAASEEPAAIARLAEVPLYNALMRTTCVATMLSGGHAPNALPQLARANVNCRMLPGSDPAEVRRTIERVVADPRITVTPVAPAKPSPPSPLRPDVMEPIERISTEMWPGVVVVPVMGAGATDGLYFRKEGIPIYGVSGLFAEVGDARAHGRDERIGVKAFYEGQDFLYRLVKALSTRKK
jgi:acetylornithine deacetylase/succinyl-diaminopimelate desuccinylase-like protein